MAAWSKQKDLRKEKIPSINRMVEIAGGIEDDRLQCLFILTYLTAGRMQEIVRYKNVEKKELRASIRVSDIDIQIKEGRRILIINIRNEKNRTRHRKTIPVPLDKPENIKFFNMIYKYLNEFKEDQELFPISYKRAYKILTDLKPEWNPHWLRHIRLTHLVTEYGFREHQLMLYAGWTDPRPAKFYLEMKWEDLLY